MSYRGEQKIKGTTYVYEATASWDKNKQHSQSKRIYIGKKDPVTGEFQPNKRYYELYPEKAQQKAHESNLMAPVSYKTVQSRDYGAVLLMQEISDRTGLTQVLKKNFPTCWETLLTLAMYLCCENSALYLSTQWAENSVTSVIPTSQRISELLSSLTEDQRMSFYRSWATFRTEKEYLALDITSISSWSDLIEMVEYGYNRDKEKLPQINLAMLFGEKSHLPVFCRSYPGSIHDVSTLEGMVLFIEELKLSQMHFVMDKGFFKQKDVDKLLEGYIKFAIGLPLTTKLAKNRINASRGAIVQPKNAIEVDGHLYYAMTFLESMNGRRAYVHVYYDPNKAITQQNSFMHNILRIEAELKNGERSFTDQDAQKYFNFHKTKSGINIHRNEAAINEKMQFAGFFVLLTNDSKDAQYILTVYRTKDVVEKSFDNYKNDLDLERLQVHSEAAMEGRIFLGFLALILMSSIRNVMKEKDLYKNYTFSTLMGEFKKLKLIEFSDGHQLYTETSKHLKSLLKAFDLKIPLLPSI